MEKCHTGTDEDKQMPHRREWGIFPRRASEAATRTFESVNPKNLPWNGAQQLMALVPLLLFIGAGCARVPVSQQSRLTKPNMVLADTAAFGYAGSLHSQIEPGAAVTGGAQAAGCTSCK